MTWLELSTDIPLKVCIQSLRQLLFIQSTELRLFAFCQWFFLNLCRTKYVIVKCTGIAAIQGYNPCVPLAIIIVNYFFSRLMMMNYSLHDCVIN